MKRNLLISSIVLLAGPLLAADAKDDVTNAAKKLADKANYAWTTTIASQGGGGGGFRPGPTEGKTEKDGCTQLSMTRGDNTLEAVLKGDKGAIKLESGWKSLTEAAEEEGPGRFAAMMLRNFKAPAAEATDLVSKVKDLKTAEGVCSGDLTDDGAKQLLTFRRRATGGDGPEISGAKGSVKFWVKDGLLSKYEFHIEGKVTFQGNEREVNRTTTVEIKAVGSTKLAVPEEASKKL